MWSFQSRLIIIVIITMNCSTLGLTQGECVIGKTNFSNFKWLNEPSEWSVENDVLTLKTKNSTDFWSGTWYNFYVATGHLYGIKISGNFTLEVCIEAEFEELYDQAGLMLYVDDRTWLKAGIEYNDGQPMIGSVLTRGVSDWATGVFNGDPRKFWLRLTKLNNVVCVKYSTDNKVWNLLRLCELPVSTLLVGPMSCTPKREGLVVKFSNLNFNEPSGDILHSN